MEAAINWINWIELPFEILERIFSYCTHSDLVQSIQNVCCRWREVAQSTSLWKDVTYCPDPNTSSEQVVEMLKISPKLQDIILQETYDDAVLQAITENCVELRKLEISESQVIHMNFIKNLQEKCPKVQHLSIPHPVLTDLHKSEVAGKFTNLKVLCLTGNGLMMFSLILKPVADYCKKLEHLEFETFMFKVNELCYLLTMRKDTLHTLGVRCCDVLGECVLPALSICELKSLSLLSYYDCQRRYEKVDHFGRLTTVRALSIKTFSFLDDLKQIFENENMAQLVELSLEDSISFDNDVAEVIVRNCPLLKDLSLKHLLDIKDATLKIISNLKDLNSLTISGEFCMTDTGISHLQGVEGLKHLAISRCTLGIENIVKLRTLHLSLEDQDLYEFPWDLIPLHMEYLQCLHLHRCRFVDMSAINKLKMQLPSLKVKMLKCL